MTEPVTRLQAALADRYRLERELGQGGMVTVYLAEDLKHHRKEPEAGGLAESYRLEGRLAALADDKIDALRAYRNYLRLRVDPEPSRVPQLDSVRAELSAVGDLEAKR